MTDVRFGSKADVCNAKPHVRFTPESGHSQARKTHEEIRQRLSVGPPGGSRGGSLRRP